MIEVSWLSTFRRGVVTSAVALGLASAAGSALAAPAVYLDDGLGEVAPADRVQVADPKPVQLIFKFETKGAPNQRVTKLLKERATQAVKDSGLFSDVVGGPTANGATLSITINDAATPAVMHSAQAQGLMTGLTLGLVASDISERYDCTVDFVRTAASDKLTRTFSQTLYFEMGLTKTAPPHATKMANLDDAVDTLTHQLVTNALNDLGKDPAFNHSMAELPWPPPEAPLSVRAVAQPHAALTPAGGSSHAGLTPLVRTYR